jgi:hypothetical protein
MISKRKEKNKWIRFARRNSRKGLNQDASLTWKSGTVLSNMSILVEGSNARISAFAPAVTSTMRSNSTEPENETSGGALSFKGAGALLFNIGDVEL